MAGAAVLSVGAFLGGHVSFPRGVGVNETTFDEGPRDWTTVEAGELEDGRPTSALAGDTPVFEPREGEDGIAVRLPAPA